jgi:glutathione S-transferase
MSELILHHYDISPYAEKIRTILGFKGLAWRSVHIPIVMPKPDVTCLTGGYRLTPILQIGADIYCDTKVIARRLEAERPEPTLYPRGLEASARGLAHWGESMFVDLVTIGFAAGIFPPDFVADRQKLVPGGVNLEVARAVAPSKRDEIRAKLQLVERQLADGRPFLLGDRANLADFSLYHPVWGMRNNPLGADFLATLPRLSGWFERIASFGHGTPTELTSGEAVEIARRCEPAGGTASAAGGAASAGGAERRPGDRVAIFPEAYGRDPVVGEIAAIDAEEIAIRRADDRAGEVVVHFPREGMIVTAA